MPPLSRPDPDSKGRRCRSVSRCCWPQFPCLLSHGDSVRALQTSDVRARQFSGRYQITADGRHLIDGIAFGRPYQKRPKRPDVKIPPRKRRKIDLNDFEGLGTSDDDSEDYAPDDTARVFEDGIDVDDASAVSHVSSDHAPDLEHEIRLLQEDQSHQDHQTADLDPGTRDDDSVMTRSQAKNAGLGVALPYYGPYYNPLLEQYCNDAPSATFASEDVKPPQGSDNDVRAAKQPPSRAVAKGSSMRCASRESNRSVHFQDDEFDTPGVLHSSSVLQEELADESDDDDDSDFEPSEIDDGSDKENTPPFEGLLSSSQSSLGPSSVAASAANPTNDDDYTSSSGSSSTSSTTDSQSDNDSDRKGVGKNLTMPERSADLGITDATAVVTEPVSFESMQDDLDEPPAAELRRQPDVPPFMGQKDTSQRNRRKKASMKLSKLKKRGVLAPSATIADLEDYLAGSVGTQANSQVQVPKSMEAIVETVKTKVAKFEARRQALLDSISAGGVEVARDDKAIPLKENMPGVSGFDRKAKPKKIKFEEDSSDHVEVTATSTETVLGVDESASATTTFEIPDSYTETTGRRDRENLIADTGRDEPATVDTPVEQESSNSQQRRTKLDLASSKRMLFSSLGLRTPKTKAEEDALREKLRKDVRPTHVPKLVAGADLSKPAAQEVTEDDIEWEEKIDLRAVECCQEGIELSKPPFPFYQRWDPQQQKGYKASTSKKSKNQRKKDRKKANQSNTSFAIESQDLSGYGASLDTTQLRFEDAEGDAPENFESEVNSVPQDESTNREKPVSASGEVSMSDAEIEGDLPQLPSDIEVHPTLEKGDCLVGAVIAFKRLIMSAETSWQPCISSYITGLVEIVDHDGIITVRVAKRDRISEGERQADDAAFSKFAMPGYDDDRTHTKDGKLSILFEEAIQPRLVSKAASKAEDRPTHTSQQAEQDEVLPYNVDGAASHHESTEEKGSLFDSQHGGTQDAQDEALHLIKEAGWNSSIGSEAARPLDLEPRQIELATTSRDNNHESPSGDFDQASSYRSPSPSPQPIEEYSTANVEQPPKSPISSPAKVSDQPAEVSGHPPAVPDEVTYPSLDGTCDDPDESWQHGQRRSLSQEPEDSLSKVSISPPALRRKDRKENLLESSPTMIADEPGVGDPVMASSDSDEFPELFSKAFEARMSQEPTYKHESSQSVDIDQVPQEQTFLTQGNKLKGKTRNTLNLRNPYSNDDSRQAYTQESNVAHAVDLTMSSDPEELPGIVHDENESSYCPSSAGWVDKPRANRAIGVSSAAKSRKKTRSR